MALSAEDEALVRRRLAALRSFRSTLDKFLTAVPRTYRKPHEFDPSGRKAFEKAVADTKRHAATLHQAVPLVKNTLDAVGVGCVVSGNAPPIAGGQPFRVDAIENWNGDVYDEPLSGFARQLVEKGIGALTSALVGDVFFDIAALAGRPSVPSAPTRVKAPDVAFVTIADIRSALEQNARELVLGVEYEMWTATCALAGAIAEGALYDVLKRHEARALAATHAFKSWDRTVQGNVVQPLEKWNLDSYMKVGAELTFGTSTPFVSKSVAQMLAPVVRDFRNLIHPVAQLQKKMVPERHEASGALAYLEGLLRDLRLVP